MKRVIPVIVLIAGALGGVTGVAAERSAAMLGDPCAGCHGTSGASVGLIMPTIAGQPEGYLVKVMRQYKKGERPSTIMNRLMTGYSDQEIAALARFFSQQPWKSNPIEVDQNMAAAGKALHEDNCKDCHADNGRDTSDDTARLAGQWPDYLEVTMAIFGNPARNVPQPRKMRARVTRLSPEAWRALAQFYAGQK